MKKLLLLTFLFISQVALAQKYTLKGLVQDEKAAGLPGATVLLLQAKDSSLVSFAATDNKGAFELKNISGGSHLLKITFLGYSPHLTRLTAPAEAGLLDLGAIQLKPLSNELKEVMVQGEKSPVVFKKDTIEYNAGSFKTQPNAVAEDLLKRLPGVDVESDGSISVKGEKVQRVTVDGKEFFGRDPKLATKNLPADAIDKVQVFDKKSDQAMFTGIDDGQREKTINLQLKEEKRNSAFGNAMAGIGTDERYQAKASLNRFSKGKQLSFLGMANNVNSQGFGFDEYMSFSGGMQQMAGGGRVVITTDNSTGVPLNFGGRTNGMMDSYAGGLNFNSQLSKKAEANGSYFLNHLNHNIHRDLERLEFLRNGDVRTNQNSRQRNGNTNHRANFTVDHKLDSVNSVKVMGAIGYNETNSNQRSQVETYSGDNILQNQSANTAFSEGTALNANGSILFRHKFPKQGRTISSNTEFRASQNQSDGVLQATNSFADGTVNVLNQENTQRTDNQSLSTTLAYTEPLGNRRYLEANYNYRQNLNQVDREVYDLNPEQGRAFNSTLSNKYNSNYQYHRTGMNFKLNRREYSLTVGSSFQHTDLKGELMLLEGDDIRDSYQNVLPALRFNYEFTGNRRIDFNYETSVQEPTIRQLQPVVDNSNPLNLYQGNPELRPAYSHQWRLNFSTFDPGTLINFFTFVNASYTTNAITNAQSYDERLIRMTQPMNVKDNSMLSAFASLGLPVKKFNSRFNLGANVRQQQSINLINELENDITIQSANGNLRYEYKLGEAFDFNIRANYTVQRTRYQFGDDQKFFNQTYSTESNLYLPKAFNINANFDYMLFDNPGFDFSQRIPMLNMSVSKQFLKNKSGELKLAALNMLDEDLGVNQTANINYVERETLNSLGRYFMLSFTYSINKHLNPMANRGARGGAVRIVN